MLLRFWVWGLMFGAVAKTPLAVPKSHARKLGWSFSSTPNFSFLLCTTWEGSGWYSQELGSLSSKWESYTDFLDPGFGMAQSYLL